MTPFVGAVLTGGASRRMGTDKAAVLVDGTPMAVRVATALRRAGAVEVVMIGLAVDGEALEPDLHPGEGPLGGVLTALAWAGDRVLVVAPCDLVAPDADAFGALVDGLATSGSAAAVGGAGEPLPLAVRPEADGVLATAFAGGERSISRGIALLDPAVIPLPAAALADADTSAELPQGSGSGSSL